MVGVDVIGPGRRSDMRLSRKRPEIPLFLWVGKWKNAAGAA